MIRSEGWSSRRKSNSAPWDVLEGSWHLETAYNGRITLFVNGVTYIGQDRGMISRVVTPDITIYYVP